MILEITILKIRMTVLIPSYFSRACLSWKSQILWWVLVVAWARYHRVRSFSYRIWLSRLIHFVIVQFYRYSLGNVSRARYKSQFQVCTLDMPRVCTSRPSVFLNEWYYFDRTVCLMCFASPNPYIHYSAVGIFFHCGL
jgi:hypothetical protein